MGRSRRAQPTQIPTKRKVRSEELILTRRENHGDSFDSYIPRNPDKSIPPELLLCPQNCPGLLQQHAQAFLDLSFGQGPGYLVYKPSVLVEEKRRNTIHSELRWCGMVYICVQLREFYPACVRKSQFVQNRREPLAMRSPGRIKLEQYRAGKVEHLFRKTRVRGLDRTLRKKARQIHRRFALAADSPVTPSLSGNAISRPASRAANDYSVRVHASTPFDHRPASYYINIKG